MASSQSARKVLPKRLEEELLDIPRYKPVLGVQPPTMRDVLDDSIERAMYDQILGPLINRRPSSVSAALGGGGSRSGISRPSSSQQAQTQSQQPLPPSLGSASTSSSSSSSLGDSFNVSILSRLSLVEGDNKDLRRQVAEKVMRIDQLERENRRLRAQVEAASSATSTKVADLMEEVEAARAHGAELEDQIEEMEQFLSDYGLVWVGTSEQQQQQQQQKQQQQEKKSGAFSQPTPFHLLGGGGGGGGGNASHTSSPSASPSRQQPQHTVNFHDFSTKVQELNRVIADEPTKVALGTAFNGTSRTARLQHASEAVEHIPVAFFKNGLLIKRGPFRDAGSPSYLSFVRDVMDGYFPSEFRREFPDGVILELKDRHHEEYRAGQAEHRMSGAQLLRRVQPAIIIRNGEVMPMRDEVDRLLGLGSSGEGGEEGGDAAAAATTTTAAAAAAVMAAKKTPVVVLATPAASGTSSPSAASLALTFVTVQVRWVDGSVLQAKMFPGDIVGDVREHVTRHFRTAAAAAAAVGSGAVAAVPEFELRAAYPPRRLDDAMTLEEAGLSPGGGVVHAKRL